MKLKEYIKSNGMSVSEFAHIVGISRQHMNNIIHGHRKVSRNIAVAIEDATDGELNRVQLIWPEDCEE